MQYERAVQQGTATLPINRDRKPTIDGSGVANGGGLPKRARGRGGEGKLNQPLGTSLPGLTIRSERKRGGSRLHSDRGNVACLRRGV